MQKDLYGFLELELAPVEASLHSSSPWVVAHSKSLLNLLKSRLNAYNFSLYKDICRIVCTHAMGRVSEEGRERRTS